MVLERAVPDASPWRPLELIERATPTPGADDLLVRVGVCGVCRTDLDIAQGRLVPPHYPVVPGHQVIGRVAAVGKNISGHREGDTVGVAWIHSACGVCEFCRAGNENLCVKFRSTGCDFDGGYADYLVIPAAFAHAIPENLSPPETAPLLCAGAVGWRALSLCGLKDGDPLGLTGFGASAHLVLQLAQHRFPRSPVFVFARAQADRDFAQSLGADWSGEIGAMPPERLAAIIDTTPAWKPIVEALAVLRPGGRIVVNAIRKETRDQNELVHLDYAKHLWMEREIKSTANVTRADVRECLEAASEWGIRATMRELPLEQANDALDAMRTSRATRGAMVLRVS